MNWKLRKAFTGNNTSDVQTINGYIAAGEDNDFSVEVSPVGKEYPAPLVVPRTNLVVTSQYAGGLEWDISSNYSVTNNVAISPEGVQNAFELTTSSTNGYIRADVSVSPFTEYTFSFYAKRGTATELKYSVYDWTNFSNIVVQTSYYSQTSATEWKRIEVTFTTPAGCTTAGVYLDRDSQSNGTAFFYGIQCEQGLHATEYIPTNGAAVTRSWDSFSRVQNQVPGICNGTHTHTGAASAAGIAATTLTGTGSGGKFKYEFDTLGKLVLIEAMTHENLLLQSNTFDTTWSLSNGTLTGGQTGYDGSSDAWQFDASGTAQVSQSVSTSGLQTFSVYAKAGTENGIFLRANGGNNPRCFFALDSGTIGSLAGGVIDSSIEDIGNGWYRCSITYNDTNDEARIYVANNSNGFPSSGNIYIQDAQLEGGSQATVYIETTTAPVREGAGQGYKVDDKLSITTNEGHDIEFRLVEGSNATTVTVGMEATKPNKPVPFPVTKMRVSDSTDRKVLIMDQRSRYVFPKPTPYLLDTYEGAAAAYSLRRLRSAYTGPAVRVRRASNNDELDIYFDGQGNLDTASLGAFCAGTDGFVKVWYDQGPQGNDAEQTNTSLQPKIVSSGSVITENGKPALEFDVDNLTPSMKNAASDYSFFSVTKSNVSESNGYTIDAQSGRLIFDIRGSGVAAYYDGAFQGTPHNSTVQQVNSIFAIAPTSGQSYINGSVVNTGLSYTQKPLGGTMRIGQSSAGSSNYWDGTMQEIVLYASDQSSNRTGIETNINDYYNIY